MGGGIGGGTGAAIPLGCMVTDRGVPFESGGVPFGSGGAPVAITLRGIIAPGCPGRGGGGGSAEKPPLSAGLKCPELTPMAIIPILFIFRAIASCCLACFARAFAFFCAFFPVPGGLGICFFCWGATWANTAAGKNAAAPTFVPSVFACSSSLLTTASLAAILFC